MSTSRVVRRTTPRSASAAPPTTTISNRCPRSARTSPSTPRASRRRSGPSIPRALSAI